MAPLQVVQLVVGLGLVVFGIRGMPGVGSLVQRRDIAHTWRHGALVFAALTYAIVVPALGAVLVLGSFR